ncbi:hypothetical protein N0V91_004198 [Didymella pomorum]|jgi:small subunit ribosomal protein MRP21|uniref:Ribosomal protein S21 n=1 Tax=Didymella pomorum TaxID=749634 RepID=A0A9W8ZH48_9PLEO|nr:hypothetical protein N0V91_004198 [Didymella pomorum]
MGSRAFGELLLRPRTFTRLTPALAPRWPARLISNTPSLSAAVPPENPETATTPEVAAQSPSRSSQNEANAAIESLFPTPSSNAAQPSNPMDRVFGSSFSKPGARRRAPPRLEFSEMNFGSDAMQNPSLSNKPTTSLEDQQKATFESYPRLNPEFGRTVKLDAARGRDIVRGIGMLGSLMSRNKVKSDFNKQRFHERGGLKRKRLNSERWRARFKTGFQQVTGRVMELTRKGW